MSGPRKRVVMSIFERLTGIHKKRLERERLEAETDRILAEISAERARQRIQARRDMDATTDNLEAIVAAWAGPLAKWVSIAGGGKNRAKERRLILQYSNPVVKMELRSRVPALLAASVMPGSGTGSPGAERLRPCDTDSGKISGPGVEPAALV